MVANFHKKANSEFFSQELLFKTVGIIFIIIICVLLVSDFKIYQKKRKLDVEIINYQKQISDIEKSSQTLKEEIANTDNKDYLEKLGYEQFNETKPGETEYMFVKPANKVKPDLVQQNWFSEAWQWIKSKF